MRKFLERINECLIVVDGHQAKRVLETYFHEG